MQTTPTPGLLHQLSELLQPRTQPQATDDRTPPPRRMVTAQRAVDTPLDQRTPASTVPQHVQGGGSPDTPRPDTARNVPRGTFLNIVV